MPHSKAAPLTFFKNIHFLAHGKHWKQWKKISTGLPQNVTPSKTGGTVFCVWFSIIKKTFWITWPFRKWKVSAARTCLFTWQWIKVKTSEITQTHSTTTSPGLCFWADFCACMKALPTHISIIKAKSRDKVFVFVFKLFKAYSSWKQSQHMCTMPANESKASSPVPQRFSSIFLLGNKEGAAVHAHLLCLGTVISVEYNDIQESEKPNPSCHVKCWQFCKP